ncbi:MAG TPA: ABC transporter permease subunit [Bacilli bacterium]|nr:ABC transporter permease subunit [Bacilli bacterium]
MYKKLTKAILLVLCVFLGIFLISNLDKGVEVFKQDQVMVLPRPNSDLGVIVARYPDTKLIDPQHKIVQVPYGQAEAYQQKMAKDRDVSTTMLVGVPVSFSFKKYASELGKQLNHYAHGELGRLTYASYQNRSYPISEQLGLIITRSLSYLVPGVLLGLLVGFGLAVTAAWKPWVGRILDKIHALLLGIPDFFLIVLIQMLAIQLAQWAGHTVIAIRQFASETPVLIPMVAISVLPGLLVYGALRLAVQREWSEGYIQTAFSKGLNRTQVLVTHLLRNTLEDLLSILPRAVAVGITSLVVAEVMTGIFGLGGYAISTSLVKVTSLPATCAILALMALLAHLVVFLLRRQFVVSTKEGE